MLRPKRLNRHSPDLFLSLEGLFMSNVEIVDIPTYEEMREMEQEYRKRTKRQIA